MNCNSETGTLYVNKVYPILKGGSVYIWVGLVGGGGVYFDVMGGGGVGGGGVLLAFKLGFLTRYFIWVCLYTCQEILVLLLLYIIFIVY